MTAIKKGINTGNNDKVYEVAKLDHEVWRESALFRFKAVSN